MREFSIKFDEGITRGLRPYAKMPRNFQALTEAVNFRVTKRGPEVPPAIIVPESWADLGVAWPYPRVFRTGHQYYLMDDDALYPINPDTLAIGDALVDGLTTVGFWTLADFGDLSILCDGGACGLYFMRSIGGSLGTSYFYKGDFSVRGPRALCNFRQQLLIGGAGFGVYHGTAKSYAWSPERGQWRNVVFWSEIGSITTDDDMISGGESFLEEIHKYINYGVGIYILDGTAYTLPFGALDMMETGWGYMPMRYNGYVWNLKPLHSCVVAYGSNGIAALIPQSSPVPTYGYKHLADFGIAGPAAVSGDEDAHTFVDEFGDLWRLKNDLSLEKLGYSEYIAPLLTSQYDSGSGGWKIAINYDTLLGDYYISNGSKTYLLTVDGLSEVKLWHPTSLFRHNGALYGVTVAGSSNGGSLVSDTIDLGIRGIKMISSLEIGADATNLEAGVDYRYASGAAYSSGIYKPTTRTGQVMPMTGGVDFRIKMRNADYTKFSPDYVNIRWKPVDKRVIRGPYEAAHGKTVS